MSERTRLPYCWEDILISIMLHKIRALSKINVCNQLSNMRLGILNFFSFDIVSFPTNCHPLVPYTLKGLEVIWFYWMKGRIVYFHSIDAPFIAIMKCHLRPYNVPLITFWFPQKNCYLLPVLLTSCFEGFNYQICLLSPISFSLWIH